jgi:predicted nucleic acid-binding protein
MPRRALGRNFTDFAEGVDHREGREPAAGFVSVIDATQIVVPFQAADDSLLVFDRKLKLDSVKATARVSVWLRDHSRCSGGGKGQVLLFEDMHDGFRWNGVTIVGPFIKILPPIVSRRLNK